MTTPPEMTPTSVNPEVSADDRLWVLLSFLLTPLLPLITLFLEDKKNRAFIKYHNVPALILGVAEGVVAFILSFIPFVGCLTPLLWIINLLLALKANKGVNVDIPIITDFSKKQGWS
jgi:uncharacterized membrane protein